ncbi:MAG: hypothetical protein K0S58_3519, partial [Nitrospira sp.]|nr:hypothetical protein [Nitrospira sp.]
MPVHTKKDVKGRFGERQDDGPY